MKLNLGAADRPFPDFISVDIAAPAEQLVDLELPWPWETSSVAEVRAHDIIEHIGDCDHTRAYCSRCKPDPDANQIPYYGLVRHPLGRIHFMNELHRVLRPGGIATIETPNASTGSGFFQDPTHKTPWCLNSFQYFDSSTFAWQRLSKSYGITAQFKTLTLTQRQYDDEHEAVYKITAVLQALK